MSPPLKYKTPQEDRQNRMTSIIDEVLGSEYWRLTIDHFSIEENLLERYTKINCIVKMHDNVFNIQEVGKGPIDALFNGLRNNFKKSFLLALVAFLLRVMSLQHPKICLLKLNVCW